MDQSNSGNQTGKLQAQPPAAPGASNQSQAKPNPPTTTLQPKANIPQTPQQSKLYPKWNYKQNRELVF